MNYKIAGALFGFLTGIIGYIIFRYWIFPIRRYRHLKSKIAKDISSYEETISKNNWNTNTIIKKRLKNTRKCISDLIECFHEEIPSWYRIKLKSRGESPTETAQQIMNLGDIRESEHAKKRLKKAKATLLIQ